MLVAFLARTAQADPDFTLERLLMPGALIAGHARIEAQCEKCHRPFDRDAQRGLCIECHEEVGADMTATEGFHGRIEGAASAPCSACHDDHRGRDADIVQLDPVAFDHALTDFVLRDAHREVPCRNCHPESATYREAPAVCLACHRADDPHEGRLGGICEDCHAEAAWDETRFEHDRTGFPLTGEHRQAPCASCHPDQRYENTPADCHACHRLDDVHAGRRGPDCERCHATDSWTRRLFDHGRDTEFALLGKHAGVSCEGCHGGIGYDDELGTACVACHAGDDVHKGRHGNECGDCHDAENWTTRFDHDRATRFPLQGRHRSVSCESCHRGGVYEDLVDTSCYGCHQVDDVHAGSLGRDCAGCHGAETWKQASFDHDLTRFPLIGMHLLAPCEQCHPTASYRMESIACVSCHEADDSHARRLGAACETCHDPSAWARWVFDHDRQTDYPLDGAHAGLDCHACHREPVATAIELGTTCITCHEQDDAHDGRFGRRCERCHVTTDFRRGKELH